jgi:hypothetical protein
LAVNVQPVVLLEDLERGSIRGWFRSVVHDVPDTTLASGEIKKVIGHYLVKAKRAIISWEDRHPEITSRAIVEELRGELRSLAENTNVHLIPAYTAPSISELAETATEFRNAAALLSVGENMRFRSYGDTVEVSKNFAVAPNQLEVLITQQVLSNRGTMILKVKKPDFLGSSQWELRHGNRAITAAIEDRDWIDRFHARDAATIIMPGDAIQASVRVEAAYGYDGELVRESYAIEQIIRVVKPPEQVLLAAPTGERPNVDDISDRDVPR